MTFEPSFEGKRVVYQMEQRRKAVCYHQALFHDKRYGVAVSCQGESKGLTSGCSLDEGLGVREVSVRRRILTCFAPGPAPHQSRVSGCRCWHTS